MAPGANVQSKDDFACHALNRDVWRDNRVENLVREGFVLWQAVSFRYRRCRRRRVILRGAGTRARAAVHSLPHPPLPVRSRLLG